MAFSNFQTSSGLVILFGSGETSSSGRPAWERVFRNLNAPPQVAILETPAGFQPNSFAVAQRVREYLEARLINFVPKIDIIPARERGTACSPDEADLLTPMLNANLLFLGAGSPTYAARQLEGSLAWDILETRHHQGASVVLASAAILAASFFTLPVYEIYKVGESLHWLTGLDFFARLGLSAVFIPHWNNNDGGAELDTSRCFMGQARWEKLKTLLPSGTPIVGIDEHTTLMLNPQTQTGLVFGTGGVTVEKETGAKMYPSGSEIAFEELGTFSEKTWVENRVLEFSPRQDTLDRIAEAQQVPLSISSPLPPSITQLLEDRLTARKDKDWAAADRIREEIFTLGWVVQDTPEGSILKPVQS